MHTAEKHTKVASEDSPYQIAKYALALGDGGHLFQGKLSQTQFTGQKGRQVHVPAGFVARAAHGTRIWDTKRQK